MVMKLVIKSREDTLEGFYHEMIKDSTRLRDWKSVEYWFHILGNHLMIRSLGI